MRVTRLLTAGLLAAAVLAAPSTASAHHDLGHAQQVVDEVEHVADALDTRVNDHATDNVQKVAHLTGTETSDIFFQRREGERVIDGETLTEGHTDLLFAGGVGSGPQGHTTIWDVTDPTNPVKLSDIPCGGFHAEVVAWENFLVQTWDSSKQPCDRAFDPEGRDRFAEGVRIFDVTDPADPEYVKALGTRDGIENEVHNATVHAEAGLVYLNMSQLTVTSPQWGYVDLTATDEDGNHTFETHTQPMRDISPTAGDGCHDLGFDYERDLAACAAISESYVWDVSDPRNPVEVGVIVNNAINIHHGARFAPNGTLVLNDELAGAAAAAGCMGTGSAGVVGALWFYDVSIPQAPVLLGSYSTPELNPSKLPCTSHFYNFIPDSNQVVVGWYESGVQVADFSTPQLAETVAVYQPEGGRFWAGYYWHGYLFGPSYASNDQAGVHVIEMEGLDDLPPAADDEGNSWVRWTGSSTAAAAATPTASGELPSHLTTKLV